MKGSMDGARMDDVALIGTGEVLEGITGR
ncbi:hypothetical protein BACI349Y_760056 [Bacillus sp. 349Y]|nr:hypothetical protein BACI349Y_760056 [Bacillus sp. 349Y]